MNDLGQAALFALLATLVILVAWDVSGTGACMHILSMCAGISVESRFYANLGMLLIWFLLFMGNGLALARLGRAKKNKGGDKVAVATGLIGASIFFIAFWPYVVAMTSGISQGQCSRLQLREGTENAKWVLQLALCANLAAAFLIAGSGDGIAAAAIAPLAAFLARM